MQYVTLLYYILSVDEYKLFFIIHTIIVSIQGILKVELCIVTDKAEMLSFLDELLARTPRTAVCFSITNFLAAPEHSRRLKVTNAAAADSFKGRQHTVGHSNDYLNTACTQDSLMEVCS